MKLRQKLAAVLAATMVITAVPVMTMAAEASLSHTVSTIKGAKVNDINLVIEMTAADLAAVANGPVEFYVVAKDAKFLAADYPANQAAALAAAQTAVAEATAAEATAQTALTDAQTDLAADPADADLIAAEAAAQIALTQAQADLAAAVAAEVAAQAAVDAAAIYTVEYLDEDELKVTLKAVPADSKNFYSINLPFEAKSGTPTLEIDGTNTFVKSAKLALTGDNQVGEKALNVTFPSTPATIPVDGSGQIGTITLGEAVTNALGDLAAATRTIKVALPTSSDLIFTDGQTIELTGRRGLSAIGAVESYDVSDNGKELTIVLPRTVATSIGSVEIKGISVKGEDSRRDVKLGEVSVTVSGDEVNKKSGVVAEVKAYGVTVSAKEVELVAGKGAKKVTLEVKESAATSLNKRHDIYVELDAANIVAGTLKVTDDSAEVDITPDLKDGNVIGFYIDLANLDEAKANTIEVTFEVAAELGETGTVSAILESRSFDKDFEVQVATIASPITVEVKGANLEVGLTGQKGGSLTLTEAEAGMIDRGQIVLEFDQRGITFSNKDLTIEATDSLDVRVEKIENNKITLDVRRTSKEAAELTISGFAFNVDRTVPNGSVALVVGGSSLADANTTADAMVETIEAKDFIQVGAKDAAETKASFVIGAATYTVNGEVRAMDAAPYVSAKNRTMMPVRYVAEAIGITGDSIMFSNVNGGTITILAGNRIVQLQNNSNVAKLNGTDIYLDEAVTIKDGRTYVPVGEIARLLGVSVEWDNDTKTATFTSK